jgi:hypothetical protein
MRRREAQMRMRRSTDEARRAAAAREDADAAAGAAAVAAAAAAAAEKVAAKSVAETAALAKEKAAVAAEAEAAGAVAAATEAAAAAAAHAVLRAEQAEAAAAVAAAARADAEEAAAAAGTGGVEEVEEWTRIMHGRFTGRVADHYEWGMLRENMRLEDVRDRDLNIFQEVQVQRAREAVGAATEVAAAAAAAAEAARAVAATEEDRALREELQAWAATPEGGAAGGDGPGSAPLDELVALYALYRAVDEEQSRTEALAAAMEAAGGLAEVTALVRELGLWWRLASNVLLHGIGAAVGAMYGSRRLAAPLPPILGNVAEVLFQLHHRARKVGALDVLERLGLAPAAKAHRKDALVAEENKEATIAGTQEVGGVSGGTKEIDGGAGEQWLGGGVAGEAAVAATLHVADSGAAAAGGSTAPGGVSASAADSQLVAEGGSRGTQETAASAGSVVLPTRESDAASPDDSQPEPHSATTVTAPTEAVTTAAVAESAAAAATADTAAAVSTATDTPQHHAAVVRALEACASDGAAYLRSAHAAVLALPPAPSAPAEAARRALDAAQQVDPRVLISTLAEAAAAAAALRDDRRSLCGQRVMVGTGPDAV